MTSDKSLKYNRQYKKDNRDKMNDYNKMYYQKNKERLNKECTAKRKAKKDPDRRTKIPCVCGKYIMKMSMGRHIKSKTHLNTMNKKKTSTSECQF